MSNMVWVKWEDAAVKEDEYFSKVINLDDSADIDDLRRAFVEPLEPSVQRPAAIQVRETRDGEMLKSSKKLSIYFVPAASSAAVPGPGKSGDTALFLTLPLPQQSSLTEQVAKLVRQNQERNNEALAEAGSITMNKATGSKKESVLTLLGAKLAGAEWRPKPKTIVAKAKAANEPRSNCGRRCGQLVGLSGILAGSNTVL